MKTVYEQYYNDEKCADLRYNIYGYSPPPAFRFEINGKKTPVINDFRTVERYKEYKDIGFNVLHAQTTGTYFGQDFATSDSKMVMDRALEAGLDRVILVDERIRLLSAEQNGLIGGEGSLRTINSKGEKIDIPRFKNQEELDGYVEKCMIPYKDHPAFYGVQFLDEPTYKTYKAMGELVKAIRKVSKTCFIKCNLFPLIVLHCTNSRYPEGGDLFDRFKRYLADFIDETGLDYVMYDNYPFYNGDMGDGKCFYRFYFKALQIAANVCKEKGAKLYFVLQSFGMWQGGQYNIVTPNEAEMYYQINTLLGFGVKTFSYYTYWTLPLVGVKGATVDDGSAIMTWAGEKTPLYGYVQKVNAMAQKLAPVILNFDYVTDRYVIKPPFKSHPFHLEYTGRGFLTKVTEAETDREVALINEMYDKKRGQWLYMVQNITYTYYEEKASIPPQTTTLTFAPEFTKVDVFDGESWKTVELIDGKYTTAPLKAGYAEYVLPY